MKKDDAEYIYSSICELNSRLMERGIELKSIMIYDDSIKFGESVDIGTIQGVNIINMYDKQIEKV